MNWTIRDRDVVYPLPDVASPGAQSYHPGPLPSWRWLLIVLVLGAVWGLSGGRARLGGDLAQARSSLPPEIGPCSPVEHLCSVDPITLEPVNRWTYSCPWGLEVRELPWPCSWDEEPRPTSETDIVPVLVVGPCYVYTDICADGHQRDWLIACTGPLAVQWGSRPGDAGEVCP